MDESDSRWRRTALLTIPTLVLLGDAIGLFCRPGFRGAWFVDLQKPPFFPPEWLFVIAWNIFYAVQGSAVAMIVAEPQSERKRFALALFFLQLLLSYAWPLILLLRHDINLAHWLVFIATAIAAIAAGQFLRIRRLSGLLLLPCLAWLVYAATLIATVASMNPSAGSSLFG